MANNSTDINKKEQSHLTSNHLTQKGPRHTALKIQVLGWDRQKCAVKIKQN
jgi:hypothetical protein